MLSVTHSRGFTLVELMLVLVVISVMLGLATVSLDTNPAKDLHREGRRLQTVLQMAADEAVVQGQEFALAFNEEEAGDQERQGYQFLILDAADFKWSPVDTRELSFHPLGEQISMSINVDGQQLDENALQQIRRMQSIGSDQALQPVLLLLSSGETSPFTITLNHSQVNEVVEIASDGVSGITLQ